MAGDLLPESAPTAVTILPSLEAGQLTLCMGVLNLIGASLLLPRMFWMRMLRSVAVGRGSFERFRPSSSSTAGESRGEWCRSTRGGGAAMVDEFSATRRVRELEGLYARLVRQAGIAT
jgi:hypothetical protein